MIYKFSPSLSLSLFLPGVSVRAIIYHLLCLCITATYRRLDLDDLDSLSAHALCTNMPIVLEYHIVQSHTDTPQLYTLPLCLGHTFLESVCLFA